MTTERRRTAGIIAGLVLLTLLAVALIFATEPDAQRSGARKKTAMLVSVEPAEVGVHQPRFTATGQVLAEQDIVLQPQVSGRVVHIAPEFIPGGFIGAGEVLLRLERADYQTALAQRQSALQQARSDLALEEGRQQVARADYDSLGEALSAGSEALVLRQPQLRAAQQRVEAAEAMVEQARLDLRRTTITAPFSAHILRRDVHLGSQVSPSSALGRLVGVERFWVAIDVPVDLLDHLDIPGIGGAAEGSAVRITDRSSSTSRQGRLISVVGAVDDRVQMARVIAAVADPLLREADGGAPLMLGSFVDVEIRGRPLSGVVRLSAAHLRKDDTVWLMADDALVIRPVEVAASDGTWVYLSSGIEAGAQVVTTGLSTPVPGAALRTAGEGE